MPFINKELSKAHKKTQLRNCYLLNPYQNKTNAI